jgi:hypothetical protein
MPTKQSRSMYHSPSKSRSETEEEERARRKRAKRRAGSVGKDLRIGPFKKPSGDMAEGLSVRIKAMPTALQGRRSAVPGARKKRASADMVRDTNATKRAQRRRRLLNQQRLVVQRYEAEQASKDKSIADRPKIGKHTGKYNVKSRLQAVRDATGALEDAMASQSQTGKRKVTSAERKVAPIRETTPSATGASTSATQTKIKQKKRSDANKAPTATTKTANLDKPTGGVPDATRRQSNTPDHVGGAGKSVDSGRSGTASRRPEVMAAVKATGVRRAAEAAKDKAGTAARKRARRMLQAEAARQRVLARRRAGDDAYRGQKPTYRIPGYRSPGNKAKADAYLASKGMSGGEGHRKYKGDKTKADSYLSAHGMSGGGSDSRAASKKAVRDGRGADPKGEGKPPYRMGASSMGSYNHNRGGQKVRRTKGTGGFMKWLDKVTHYRGRGESLDKDDYDHGPGMDPSEAQLKAMMDKAAGGPRKPRRTPRRKPRDASSSQRRGAARRARVRGKLALTDLSYRNAE